MGILDQDFLLKGLKNNERKSIDTIYKLSYPMIQSFILNNNGSVENAKDIFQEAIIVLFQKVSLQESFSLSRSISTYLFEISRRLWLKHLNKNENKQNFNINEQNNITSTLTHIETDLDEYDEYQEKTQKLNIALSSLGEPCSSILKAYYNEGKSMNQICQDFGYTNENNAKNQKYKCLIRLKKIFFND